MNDLAILQALRTRCADINPVNGYTTDAGLRIHYAQFLDEEADILPALVVTQPPDDSDVPDEDASGDLYLLWNSRFIIEGYAVCNKDDPMPALSVLANDIRRAVYRPDDPTLGGVATDVRLVAVNKQIPAAGSTAGMVQVILLVQHIEHY